MSVCAQAHSFLRDFLRWENTKLWKLKQTPFTNFSVKINFCQFQANWTGYSLVQFSNVWLVSCWCLMAIFLHTATYDVSNISLMSLMMYLVCHKMCVLTSYIFGWLGFLTRWVLKWIAIAKWAWTILFQNNVSDVWLLLYTLYIVHVLCFRTPVHDLYLIYTWNFFNPWLINILFLFHYFVIFFSSSFFVEGGRGIPSDSKCRSILGCALVYLKC